MNVTPSNKTVFKYELKPDLPQDGFGLCEVELPRSAEVLSAGVQGDTIQVWACVEKGDPTTRTRRFAIVPTGGTVPIVGMSPRFIQTVFLGPYVFHIFML